MKNTNKTTKNQEQIMEIVPEEPKTRSVKDVLAEDVIMIHGLNFTMAEAEKFMPIFAKIKDDLTACVAAIDREEKKAEEAKKNAAADTE